MSATDDVKLSILSDHYKDTCKAITQLIKVRDRAFVLILILLGVMAFQFVSPQQSESLLTELAKKQLGIDANPSITIIGSLLWFSLLAVALRYFQTTVNLEKQYKYVHKLEDGLSSHYQSGVPFTREGKSYLQSYPTLLKWLHLVYRFIFPILLTVATIVKLMAEWQAKGQVLPALLFDTIIFVLLAISTFFYVLNIYFKK